MIPETNLSKVSSIEISKSLTFSLYPPSTPTFFKATKYLNVSIEYIKTRRECTESTTQLLMLLMIDSPSRTPPHLRTEVAMMRQIMSPSRAMLKILRHTEKTLRVLRSLKRSLSLLIRDFLSLNSVSYHRIKFRMIAIMKNWTGRDSK